MKLSNYFLTAALAIAFLLSSVSQVQAQRLSGYQELAMESQQQKLFFDFTVLPGRTDSAVTFSSIFSFTYDSLPFKKSNKPTAKSEFISTVNLNMEVFNSTEAALRKNNVSIEGLEPAARAFWSDTAFAQSYEQSQSDQQFLSGHLNVSLKPGIYSYVIQMNRLDDTEDRISRVQSVKIKPFSEIKIGDVLFGDRLITNDATTQLKLTSMGHNVIFGKDFYAFAYIPQYEDNATYTLQVHSLNVVGNDTSKVSEVYSQKLMNNDIRTKVIPKFAGKNAEGNFINLLSSNTGYAFALIKLPGSTFPNSHYRLTISESEADQIVSQTAFQTLWTDMPTSLLSLDVSIDMLRFIVDDKTLDRISRGSQSEREKKFREFWKQRDPTPKTAFNELMAEYYRRIDYAYENFSSRDLPGYESDQGKIYIKFGPPQNVERKFPADGATTEIWKYPNRQFIFKATSGFGDFKLVSE